MDGTIKFAIISKALSMFNIEIAKEDIEETENIKHEVALSLMWLDSAYSRSVHSFKWEFLTEPIEFERIELENISTSYGFIYAYKITDEREIVDISKIIQNHDYHKQPQFRKNKKIIYTNARDIEIFAIIKPDMEELKEIAPIEFIDLISYQLAILIAPALAPKDTAIQQLIASQYNLVNNTLMREETVGQMKRFSNEEVD